MYNNSVYDYINYDTVLGAPIDTEGTSLEIFGKSQISEKINIKYSTKLLTFNDKDWSGHRLSSNRETGLVNSLGISWNTNKLKFDINIYNQDYVLDKSDIRSSFGLDFFGKQIESEDNIYNDIMEKIKKNCKYYDVLNENGNDYVCYSCPQSTYKGKIGFTKIDGSGMIKHIIPKQPITFNDVMSINSVKTFQTVLNGKGYHFSDENEDWINYGINIISDSSGTYSKEWISYNKKTNEFYFKYGYNDDYDDDFYDVLIDDIKKNCTFYDTLKNNGPNKRDYISYSCPQSTYKGKIGYTITDSISLIKHIIQIEEE